MAVFPVGETTELIRCYVRSEDNLLILCRHANVHNYSRSSFFYPQSYWPRFQPNHQIKLHLSKFLQNHKQVSTELFFTLQLYVCLTWIFSSSLGLGTKPTRLGFRKHLWLPLNNCFGRHDHGWRWFDLPWKIGSFIARKFDENGSNCSQPFGRVGCNNATRCEHQLIRQQCENHISGLAQMFVTVFLWFAANLIS